MADMTEKHHYLIWGGDTGSAVLQVDADEIRRRIETDHRDGSTSFEHIARMTAVGEILTAEPVEVHLFDSDADSKGRFETFNLRDVYGTILDTIVANYPDSKQAPAEPVGFDALTEAFGIFRKYGNPGAPIGCEHDELNVYIDPTLVTSEDLARLDVLGFAPVDDDRFQSHV